MPPIIPPRKEQAMQALAHGANGVRAMATQQQVNVSTPTGQVAFSTGLLLPYPPPPANYTTGYGYQTMVTGTGGPPAMRSGVLQWVINTTLAAGATAGASSIETNNLIQPPVTVTIDTGSLAETISTYSESGSGPWTIGLTDPLAYNHASGAPVTYSWDFTGTMYFDDSGNVRLIIDEHGARGYTVSNPPTVEGYVGLFGGTGTFLGILNY